MPQKMKFRAVVRLQNSNFMNPVQVQVYVEETEPDAAKHLITYLLRGVVKEDTNILIEKCDLM